MDEYSFNSIEEQEAHFELTQAGESRRQKSKGIKPQLCDGWRDVRKEIPEPLTTVLIYFNLFGIDQIETAVMKSDGEMMEDVFEYSKCGKVRVKNCIAWMPLSEIGKPAFA